MMTLSIMERSNPRSRFEETVLTPLSRDTDVRRGVGAKKADAVAHNADATARDFAMAPILSVVPSRMRML